MSKRTVKAAVSRTVIEALRNPSYAACLERYLSLVEKLESNAGGLVGVYLMVELEEVEAELDRFEEATRNEEAARN